MSSLLWPKSGLQIDTPSVVPVDSIPDSFIVDNIEI